MSLQQVLQLNNQTVSLLHYNRFQDAVQTSSSAMETFKKLGHKNNHYIEQVSLKTKKNQSKNACIDECIISRQTDRYFNDETMGDYIFQHGIILPLVMTDASSIIPVLVFNAALSHQLAARHDDDESRSQLDTAMCLYKLAINGQDQQDLNKIFKFSIINNIAVLQKELGNYEETKKCLNYLESTMMIFVVMEYNEHVQQLQGFWINVFGNNKTAVAA